MQCVVIGTLGTQWRCGLTGEPTPLRMLDPVADLEEPHCKHLHNFAKDLIAWSHVEMSPTSKPVMARLTCSLTQIVGKRWELTHDGFDASRCVSL